MTDSTASLTNEASMLTAVRERIYTPVVCDILDEMGRLNQFLPPEIRPMERQMKLVGRAMPVLTRDIHGSRTVPFGRMMEALDQLDSDEVYVSVTGRSLAAAWGEIMTATARQRGATGAVIDGFHRDTHAVLEQDFPVFSRGSYALDTRPRAAVVDYRVSATIGSVTINPGDLVIGDIDGVVIIPREIEHEVLERALEKAGKENTVRAEIEAGVSASDVFRKYGIL
ncbi:RraA family protein [Microbacterium sp. NPDC057650]|uniref:RraA family protein n=1 Tax=unclassified Microbacterium TaxID=2609290 RepID=UPI00366B7784